MGVGIKVDQDSPIRIQRSIFLEIETVLYFLVTSKPLS